MWKIILLDISQYLTGCYKSQSDYMTTLLYAQNQKEKVMANFGQNVHRIRLEKDLTQEEFAEGAGISQVQIARIEAGQINTSISIVVAIAQALGVKEGELFQHLRKHY